MNQKTEFNGEKIRVIVKEGWLYSKLIEHHANKCSHCEEITRIYSIDLTPYPPAHPENTELPGHEYTIYWDHTCDKCKTFKARIMRLIRGFKTCS